MEKYQDKLVKYKNPRFPDVRNVSCGAENFENSALHSALEDSKNSKSQTLTYWKPRVEDVRDVSFWSEKF